MLKGVEGEPPGQALWVHWVLQEEDHVFGSKGLQEAWQEMVVSLKARGSQ